MSALLLWDAACNVPIYCYFNAADDPSRCFGCSKPCHISLLYANVVHGVHLEFTKKRKYAFLQGKLVTSYCWVAELACCYID